VQAGSRRNCEPVFRSIVEQVIHNKYLYRQTLLEDKKRIIKVAFMQGLTWICFFAFLFILGSPFLNFIVFIIWKTFLSSRYDICAKNNPLISIVPAFTGILVAYGMFTPIFFFKKAKHIWMYIGF
jgi:hypothetical protein